MPPSSRPLEVIVVGQTPPPHMGQAICTQMLLDGRYERVRLHHIRMHFSRDIGEIGRFRLGKLAHLAVVVARIVVARFRCGADTLYYMPAGPNRTPMYRDFAVLLATRWLFRHLVLHFHAAGLSELYPRLWLPERLLFGLSYRGADVGIRLSAQNPDDARALGTRTERIVVNGLEDVLPRVAAARAAAGRPVPRLLYVGLLRASKGVLVLLDACRRLRDRGVPFGLRMIGDFSSAEFRDEVAAFIAAHGLESRVELTGVLTGDAKWTAMAECDVMAFPTYYENESSGLVVLEAMCLGMPVVATDWRGVGSLVEDVESGYLVPIRNAEALAERLGTLLGDPELRSRMGRRGRTLYEAHYTAERFRSNMEEALLAVRRP